MLASPGLVSQIALAVVAGICHKARGDSAPRASLQARARDAVRRILV